MKTVIEMWHKAWPDAGAFVRASAQDLERFAELIRADEREKYKWDVHSCGPTCTRYACVAMREAVKAEREACSRVRATEPRELKAVGRGVLLGEQQYCFDKGWREGAASVRAAIRARSKT